MEKVGNITKNTSYLTFALILQKIISFTYFTLLARNLGPEDLGKYYFAISFTTVFALLIDIGMINVLTRETAKRQNEASKLLGAVLAIKLPLALLTIIGTLVAVQLGDYGALVESLIYISLACVILDSFTTTFWAVARGFHNLLFESISSVLFQIIVMSFGLFFLYQGYSLTYIISALLLASIFHFCYSSTILIKKFRITIAPVFNKALITKILIITVPFGLFAAFQKLYMYLDSVLLGIMAGNEQVGYYQISFKIIFALQFLPMAFVASLYPAMSNFWQNDRKQLSITFEKAITYLMVISIPISAGVVALADKIMLIFRGSYSEAILPMQIIILSVFFVFINFPIGSLLNACDRQKTNTLNMAIATSVSIIMNLILIPRFQALGASTTVLFTNILMTMLGLWAARKIISINQFRFAKALAKVVASALIMGLFAFYLKDKISIIAIIPLSALLYFSLLLALKTVNRDEIKHICNSFLKR